jgi:ribosomal-protein-alanine N-acetyltransferase
MIELGTVVVRRMRLRDMDAVRDIDGAVYSRPWSAATWRHELGDPQRHHLVAICGGDVIGHAGALFVAGEAHITTVAVAPGSQGRGVATLMVLELLDVARERDIDTATLEVRSADRRAQRIYSRLGFAPAGIRRRYYSEPVDDAVIMWLADLGGSRLVARHAPIRESLEHTVSPSETTHFDGYLGGERSDSEKETSDG